LNGYDTSEYYFPIFEEALAKQNVPLEIKYLAIVESALNPKAVSKNGLRTLAVYVAYKPEAIWFKNRFLLDERSDPLKPIEAAAQYITNMYKMFGDWDLVFWRLIILVRVFATKTVRRSGAAKLLEHQNLLKKHKDMSLLFWQRCTFTNTTRTHGIVPEASVKHFAGYDYD
jgi:membrane-bound lytic murein transglycosylase D